MRDTKSSAFIRSLLAAQVEDKKPGYRQLAQQPQRMASKCGHL